MKKNIILLLVFFSLFISCKTSKNIILNESKYFTDSIYSNSLSEYRKHNIYLPKGFNSKNNYPIVYATDGNKIVENNFIKNTLDSLINREIIKPIIYVESHSNRKIADSSGTIGNGKKYYLSYRNFDYVENQINDSLLLKRFGNHMHYFKNEMITHIEKQFNQKNNKENRYFHGVSNGADFGLSLLNKYPDLIGTYLCFSAVGLNSHKEWRKDVFYPNLYMIYGTREGDFVRDENEFMKKVYAESNSYAEINSFVGGHDYRIWNAELIKLLTKLFSTNK
jgi:enterochelin esterase-like enzyme